MAFDGGLDLFFNGFMVDCFHHFASESLLAILLDLVLVETSSTEPFAIRAQVMSPIPVPPKGCCLEVLGYIKCYQTTERVP